MTAFEDSQMTENSYIEFKSNSVYSFCRLWEDCRAIPGMAPKVLSGFSDTRIAKLADIKAPRGISRMAAQENFADFSPVLGHIKNNFSQNELKCLSDAYEAYSDFFEKNQERIKSNFDTICKKQALYMPELANIYNCFQLPRDKKCPCFINPFPQDKFIDGISNNENICMNYSLNKTENQDQYFDNSDILKRKNSTPFHEATHFCFFNSQLYRDIEQENNRTYNTVLGNLMETFEQNNNNSPKTPRDELKKCAIGIINEGFAACASALYNEKTTGKPVKNDNEWYHGWKEANDFTKQMYPLFKEYVNQGKAFDNCFFNRLNITMVKAKIRKQQQNHSAVLQTTPLLSKVPYGKSQISTVNLNSLRYLPPGNDSER